jgi:hypothetical protein
LPDESAKRFRNPPPSYARAVGLPLEVDSLSDAAHR